MKTLSRIGSGLGIPLYANDCTTKADRISYARVLIEMDITRALPETVCVQDPTRKCFEQVVTYNWRPIFCNICLQLGHQYQQNKKKDPPKPIRQHNQKFKQE